MKTDSQTIELRGRHRLIDELLGSGIEVALPIRDRGVDLIAYLDHGDQTGKFRAWPIQLKASTSRHFGIARKYEPFKGLLFVHLWGVGRGSKLEAYLTSYEECLNVADSLGWTGTISWKQGHAYSSSKPGKQVLAALKKHAVSPGSWESRLSAYPHVTGLIRKGTSGER